MTIELTKILISRLSVTPDDAGCQQLLAARLGEKGFSSTNLRFNDVDNIWLTHGKAGPVFTFLGHTDVVPSGPIAEWYTGPFTPTIKDGYLYGRGAADMKGSIAAMVTAMERYIDNFPNHPGTLSMLLTSDEEGLAVNGTARVVEYLAENNIPITWCLVGEPSSRENIGDVIKVGRRGSLSGELLIHGIQGHVAYPDLADNPIHRVAPALTELCNMVWDEGNEYYPPTSFQISNIHGGTGASNVIPGTVKIDFNFRYSTAITENELINGIAAILEKHKLRYQLDWLPSSKPFLTGSGKLLKTTTTIIKELTGRTTEHSTSGGTSDGRFIAPTGAEVIELGPVNATIHKVNECVKTEDLETLSRIYEGIIEKLFE